MSLADKAYGYRARVGQLYPSGGLCDFEMQRMAPEGVQFVTTRMPFRDTSKESDLALVRDLENNARLLADAQVGLIAFNCTAASLLCGPAVIRERIRAATGIDSITTIEAVEDALRRFSARRIGLFTPYRREVIESEKEYLVQQGYEICAEAHIECLDPVQQGSIPPATWLDLARRTDVSGCDTLLFSCAGIYLSPVLAGIEQATGKPVVSSNAALLWRILRELGIAGDPAHGRLFAA
ncbi:MAG TPA: arylmalonate decarboxylase [Bordetella sp.]